MIPVVLGALTGITKNFEKCVDKIRIKIAFYTAQKKHIIRDSKNIEKSVRMLTKEKG